MLKKIIYHKNYRIRKIISNALRRFKKEYDITVDYHHHIIIIDSWYDIILCDYEKEATILYQ